MQGCDLMWQATDHQDLVLAQYIASYNYNSVCMQLIPFL